MAANNRVGIAGLALSASALVALITHESYTDRAIIPTKNDRPTVGFGSTFWETGAPVKQGDTITPVRAVALAQKHISKEEESFRSSLPNVRITQAEYDVYMDWIYQYGSGAWSTSSMRRDLLAGDNASACTALLKYHFSGGFDCSIPGNKICAGVWTRQLERHAKCVRAQ